MENMEKSIGQREEENNKMTINDFLNLLEENIINEKKIFNVDIQKLLLEYYKKINKSLINNYYIDKSSNHYFELYNNINDSYFTIYYSKEDIQIVINDLEIIYFFDDNDFILNYRIMLESFFNGCYNIKSTFSEKFLLKQELNFKDLNLRKFTIKNEFKYFFRFFINKKTKIVEENGCDWIV